MLPTVLRNAEDAGLSLIEMALAIVITHPAVTAAIIGPRTPEPLDGLLVGLEVRLTDDELDRIDAIVPPGVDVAPLEGPAYVPPSLAQTILRRRRPAERAAA